ncbi:hypothetical protein [Alcanivorax sp.]|uniref:hypothetical protein n=1 Tax=Alcanivorax sp. TaxID=1872427 RepID=UPI000C119CE8|nr:hypothetical protein [Alcanivorax sp.]PHR68480.1 MAG: hypothetical protein COA55_00220 [Alcanivorax sp.]
MTRRRWKHRVPSNLRQAMAWCLDYAREVHNLSVEGIATKMALANHWSIYKWIENGRMPAVLIPAYEAACGIDFVSRFLAGTGGHLVVEIPRGKVCDAQDVMQLQGELSGAIKSLTDFYSGKQTAEDTLAQLKAAMQGLAYHHRNVEQHPHPELPLGGEEDV